MKKITIESELANALFRLSYGKLNYKEATKKAKEIAPNFDSKNKMLSHKGINWYAKQVLAKM